MHAGMHKYRESMGTEYQMIQPNSEISSSCVQYSSPIDIAPRRIAMSIMRMITCVCAWVCVGACVM